MRILPDALRRHLIAGAYRLPMLPRRQLLYLIHQARWARLRNPHLMTEKINWRILYDRREVLAWTCDKLATKQHAVALAPTVRVPKVFWQGCDVGELADVELPDDWVLKPNHRSGQVIFGQGRPDVEDLRLRTAGWLDEVNYEHNGEWAYSRADRLMYVEESLIRNGNVPDDYKFYVFDGMTQLIQFERGRFDTNHSRGHFDALWRPVKLKVGYEEGPPIERPEQLDAMLNIARSIGEPFDFMRVDLYEVDGAVWLGEVTPYPASGHVRYEPRIIDARMGSYWTLPGRKDP